MKCEMCGRHTKKGEKYCKRCADDFTTYDEKNSHFENNNFKNSKNIENDPVLYSMKKKLSRLKIVRFIFLILLVISVGVLKGEFANSLYYSIIRFILFFSLISYILLILIISSINKKVQYENNNCNENVEDENVEDENPINIKVDELLKNDALLISLQKKRLKCKTIVHILGALLSLFIAIWELTNNNSLSTIIFILFFISLIALINVGIILSRTKKEIAKELEAK